MLRWLGRLLLIGLILGAIGFAVSRLLGQDDDFDDFDDIEEGFEYTETPVEIDVPADTSASDAGATQALSADATQALGSNDTDTTQVAMDTAETGSDDAAAQASADSGGSDSNGAQDSDSAAADIGLQEIKGIGPAYEQSLMAIGINHPGDLVNADPSTLSDQLNVIGGQATVEDWISQARELASEAGSGSGSDNATESNS